MARLAREEGILVGGSAGAALAGALQHARALKDGARSWSCSPTLAVTMWDHWPADGYERHDTGRKKTLSYECLNE